MKQIHTHSLLFTLLYLSSTPFVGSLLLYSLCVPLHKACGKKNGAQIGTQTHTQMDPTLSEYLKKQRLSALWGGEPPLAEVGGTLHKITET